MLWESSLVIQILPGILDPIVWCKYGVTQGIFVTTFSISQYQLWQDFTALSFLYNSIIPSLVEVTSLCLLHHIFSQRAFLLRSYMMYSSFVINCCLLYYRIAYLLYDCFTPSLVQYVHFALSVCCAFAAHYWSVYCAFTEFTQLFYIFLQSLLCSSVLETHWMTQFRSSTVGGWDLHEIPSLERLLGETAASDPTSWTLGLQALLRP